jgi:hypothetical protein
MHRLTNADLHTEIVVIKKEIGCCKQDLEEINTNLKEVKKVLLDPDSGAIARINKNTRFRKSSGKALWTIYAAIVGILGKLIFWN